MPGNAWEDQSLEPFYLSEFGYKCCFRFSFELSDTSGHSALSKPRTFCGSTLKLYPERKFSLIIMIITPLTREILSAEMTAITTLGPFFSAKMTAITPLGPYF